MKKIIFTLCVFVISLDSLCNQPIRIVCMGNSITQGKVINGIISQLSYRPGLWEKLDSAGVEVDMVGYTKLWFDEKSNAVPVYPVSRYTFKTFDRDHDSYYGIKIRWIAKWKFRYRLDWKSASKISRSFKNIYTRFRFVAYWNK